MNFGFLLSEHYQKTNIMKDENQENLVLVEFLTLMSELHLALSQNVFLKIYFSKCLVEFLTLMSELHLALSACYDHP